MKMNIRVDHHQHEIIDPLVRNETRQRLLDCRDGIRLFGKGFARQLRVSRSAVLGDED
jgi:hypothetical protein